ncbi:hypothetical protein LWC34_38850 [Kibdelosporangium philippinense]|uniref:Uncharacterized protein n=1 Tax=Kibdelosporangium philippinense TaxID=211113 RepID=A0ABS8ZLT4_9PSEU|nr:hypothetical protein [Kibdelosporangium philippinense]MCE7008729.1 hypothetical protein [Kibdelosporangium philippinense]
MDKSILLARGQQQHRDTDEVPIGYIGAVTVRGLTRAEVRQYTEKDGTADENGMIACALVDPEMTADEVGQWLDGAPAGDSVAVMDAIARLSGFDEGAQKSRVPRHGKRRRR